VLAILLAASAFLTTAQANEEEEGPDPTCAITRSTVIVRRFADLPAAIRDDVLRGGAIAEAGQPFIRSDVVRYRERGLPDRRFVMGGSSDGNWFVWFEHGGFARHYHVLGYHPVYSSGNERPDLLRAADFIGEPCEAINAFLRGVMTSLE
jgi:hypothetical protein